MNDQAHDNACWCALEHAERPTVFAHISRHAVVVSGLKNGRYQLASSDVTTIVEHARCGMNAITTAKSQGCISDYQEVAHMFEEVLGQYDVFLAAGHKLRASA